MSDWAGFWLGFGIAAGSFFIAGAIEVAAKAISSALRS